MIPLIKGGQKALLQATFLKLSSSQIPPKSRIFPIITIYHLQIIVMGIESSPVSATDIRDGIAGTEP